MSLGGPVCRMGVGLLFIVLLAQANTISGPWGPLATDAALVNSTGALGLGQNTVYAAPDIAGPDAAGADEMRIGTKYVPEPASLLPLGLGLMGLILRRRENR